MKEENREEAAVFNMAIATLQRIDLILREIKLISVGNSMQAYGFEMNMGLAQHTKLKLVKQLFIQSIPLFNPKQRDKQKKEIQGMIDKIQPPIIKHISRYSRRGHYFSEGYSPDVEKQLDEVVIRIEEILQQEQYFMPPKSSPKHSWKES